MEIVIKGQLLRMLPQKALLWPSENALLLSDIHIGKIMHFRKSGIALPHAAIEKNFQKLDHVLHGYHIEKIFFLGDLFHSEMNGEWDLFVEWKKKYHGIEMHIIPGNHDRFVNSHYPEAGLHVHEDELQYGPFTLTHHPREPIYKNEYVIAGHLHPVISFSGRANDYFRLPCFHFGRHQCVLPGFGYFTGGFNISPESGDTVVAIVNNKLVDVSVLT